MKPLIFVILSSIVCGGCSESALLTPCTEFDQLDRKMLDIHEEIKVQYASHENFLKKLRDAQVYWLQYRDRHIRALYPQDKKKYKEEYGDTYSQCKCDEMNRLTKLRIIELEIWLNGSDMHRGCPSSIK